MNGQSRGRDWQIVGVVGVFALSLGIAQAQVVEFSTDPPDSFPEGTLQAAVQGDDEKELARLLDAGADVNSVEGGGGLTTPLQLAALRGRLNAARMLLENGAKIDLGSFNGSSLHHAARGNHPKMIEFLLQRGAAVELKGPRGTALHEAAFFGSTEAARTLLAKGADVKATNGFGHTPLQLAQARRNRSVADLLLSSGGG